MNQIGDRYRKFYKMTGSGNDFVFLDGRDHPVHKWSPERIREICARGTGIGADGLVILEPGSAVDRVRFNFFNADGGRAEMCGNASLCAARIAARLGMASPHGMVLETDAGEVRARCLEDGERAEVVLWDVEAPAKPHGVEPVRGERGLYQTRVGVPHLVVVVDDVDAESADPLVRGRALRHHPGVGPAGANVNFVSAKSGEWRVRTFERGVEDETLACGTGSIATAAVLSQIGEASLPAIIRTASGCALEISGDVTPDGGLRAPRLAGQARLVFEGWLPAEMAG
jgi:diaminopimelate epimerase